MSLSAMARVALTNSMPGNVGASKEVGDAIDNSTNGGNLSQIPVANFQAIVAAGVSANQLAVGPAGITNPTFNVDASTPSCATGWNVKGAAAGAGAALSVISSAGNENGTIDAKGTGAVIIASLSTGIVSIGRGSGKVLLESSTSTSPAGTAPTLTAAQLVGGYLLFSGQTTAVTATTDTAANIDAALPSPKIGDMFSVVFSNGNTTSGTVAFAGGSGVTIRGNTAAIAITKGGTLTFVRTANTPTYDCVVQGS